MISEVVSLLPSSLLELRPLVFTSPKLPRRQRLPPSIFPLATHGKISEMWLTSGIESPKRPPFSPKSSKGRIFRPGFCTRSLDPRRPPFPAEKMEARVVLIVGSHNRNELIVIRRDGKLRPKPLQQIRRQICQIFGDDVGLTADGELFMACNECAFAIYHTCYEYESREGSQVCPQCKTRFKRLRGCSRVSRDEEEDDVNDLENEFSFIRRDRLMIFLRNSMLLFLPLLEVEGRGFTRFPF